MMDRKCNSTLHLALKGGHIEIGSLLIEKGADLSDLFISLIEGYTERLKVLEVINPLYVSKLCRHGLLHKPVRLGYHGITRFLLSCKGIDVNVRDSVGQMPLHCALEIGNEDIVSALLTAGHKLDASDGSARNVLHLSAIYGHHALMESFIKRGLDPNEVDLQGKTSLHYGVIYRQDDIVSLLLRLGAEWKVKDRAGKIPIDYLHYRERNSAIFKELTQHPLSIKVLPLKETNQKISRSCFNLAQLSKEPGIGSVNNINEFVMTNFIGLVRRMVEKVIHDALPSDASVKVVGCGSSFEGSKVGMPDELDFLIEIGSIHRNPGEETEGYGKMEHDEDSIKQLNIHGTYGVWLWDTLMTYWRENHGKDIGDGFRLDLPPQRHPDRKTCTTWIWLYSNEMFQDLPVSIDFVPAIKTDCLAEERTTWMMTKEEIRKKHRYIVPKIPYENSDVSKSFKSEDLNQLGRISYPTLEVEHMQSLDERLMDVFITVKSLRRPEVCGFKIRNENGKAVAVGEHITSYRLKSVFLHLVELFLKSKTLSHGKMVLMVYEHMEKCLARRRLPSFFDPTVDVLAGCRLNTKDSHIVAKMMARLVKSMYERDFQSAVAKDLEEEQEIIRVSRAEYDEKEKFCKMNEYAYYRQYGAWHMPIYL
ncbi:uncharacterized protein LOC135503293 [Lineus longissimus]|uniref:uncharacterized protein LOC135503293 n=1 Tax=Lineus longissimus TaxID=88925 RepID=UPI00315C8B27